MSTEQLMMDPKDEVVDDDNEQSTLSLRPHVYFPGVVCLNEEVRGQGASVLKVEEEQFTSSPSLCSNQDAEMLLFVPFMETVTVQSILIGRRSNDDRSYPPRMVKVFVDRDDIDFEMARELPATATLELHMPQQSTATEIQHVPVGRFRNVSSVTLFFASNHSGQPTSITEVTHVGFHGVGTHMTRSVVVSAVHAESQSRLENHAVHGPGVSAQEGMGC